MNEDKAEGPDMGSVSEISLEAVVGIVPAWEEIAIGRFKPRRIRGSFPGRELG